MLKDSPKGHSVTYFWGSGMGHGFRSLASRFGGLNSQFRAPIRSGYWDLGGCVFWRVMV